jgi:hypothetical protein
MAWVTNEQRQEADEAHTDRTPTARLCGYRADFLSSQGHPRGAALSLLPDWL